MGGQHFDQFTRDLVRASWTRRRLARLLSGAAAAQLLVWAAPDIAAKKKKKKKPKQCTNGAVKCGSTCVNTQTNALHCGGCGRRCGENIVCVNGSCLTGGCPGNQLLCGALCLDPSDNEQHCGDCNQPCNGDLTCLGGQCGCASGTKCDTDCVDIQTDAEHCGGCNRGCNAGETCVGEQCNPSGCGPGERDCGGGLCIPDDDEHCCNLADCGGQFSDLFCNATTHRCQCEIAGRGRCTEQARFSCAPCCPGSDFDLGARCAGDDSELVCVSPTVDGCRCPDAMPFICSAFNQTKCTFDNNWDPRVCGRFCEQCGPGGLCCGGQCHYGCPRGVGGSCATGPCNGDCSPCGQGLLCCNFGSGPVCVPGSGSICFP